jgi:hypothetical protein
MRTTLRNLTLMVSGFVLLSFGVLVVNQTAQVVQLANKASPTLGTVTLWTLVAVYGTLLGVPVVMFVRLPSPLVPPAKAEGPEYDEHLKRLRERLSASPHLAGCDLSSREGIEEGLAILATKANEIVRETAATVFVATAVSQSGRLDGLLVLSAQSRMVWRIARLYSQRPNLRDLTHLYANVAGTTFLAGELQDLDLGDQVEPILSSAVSALGASLPGLQVAGAILANCVLDGSANAFLTLRVGMIAKRHCGALVVEPKASVRRAATAEAATYLGAIVADGTKRISIAVWRASVDKVNGAVASASNRARDAGSKFMAKVRGFAGREQAEPASS